MNILPKIPFLFPSILFTAILFISACGTDSQLDNNFPSPELAALEASPAIVNPGDTAEVHVSVSVQYQPPYQFTYTFHLLEGGSLTVPDGSNGSGVDAIVNYSNSSASIFCTWTAPQGPGEYPVKVTVLDELTDREVTDTLIVSVWGGKIKIEDISVIGPPVHTLLPGETQQVEARALDINGNPIPGVVNARWSSGNPERAEVSSGGLIQAGETTGNVWIIGEVTDPEAGDSPSENDIFRDSVAVWIQPPESKPSAFEITLYFGDAVPDTFRMALETAAERWEEVIREPLPSVRVDTVRYRDVCTNLISNPPDSLYQGVERGVRIYVSMYDDLDEQTSGRTTGGPCIQRPLPYPTAVMGIITGSMKRFFEGIDNEELRYVIHHEIGHVLGLVGLVQGHSPDWLDLQSGKTIYRGHLGLHGYYLDSETSVDSLITNGHWMVPDLMGNSELNSINHVTIGGLMDLGYPAAWYGAGETTPLWDM